MSILFPIDENGNAIPVLGFKSDGTQVVTADSTPVRRTVPLDRGPKIITIVATGTIRFAIGDATVSANIVDSPALISGMSLDLPVHEDRNVISILAEHDSCDVYIMQRE